jgi:site-specific DNA recombinase
MTTAPAPVPVPGIPDIPVPVAWLGRTSTLVLQDPDASLRRQLGKVQDKLPPGWFIAGRYWDVESGGLDLEARGHGSYDHLNIGVPRDGGLADLLQEAASPAPRFAVVMCEDIARSGRDTYNALKLEKQLSAAGIPLVAADEPINDAASMTATTLLLRRMKQAVAEWYRYEVKEKAADGFKVHSLDGYNIGPVPYGYAPDRIPHPVPSKAAQGRTKTRLVPDPVTAPVVAQIYQWRVADRLGANTIASRLNADPHRYPPPGRSGCWQVSVVARILANPKYTGYMVYGRTATKNGKRGHQAPAEKWLWSAEPAHPAIITRSLWDAAQAAGAEHGTSRDGTAPSTHPAASYNYPLRGIIRCRICKRRMTGRGKLGRKGQVTRYYQCTHDPANPRHANAHPGHPASVLVREDLMAAHLAEFFDTRVFGPRRRELLAATLPAGDADAAARRDEETAALTKRLERIDASENAHAREIEHLSALPPDSPAIAALRTRILARFSELENERANINAKLAHLAATAPAVTDPALLDRIPQLPGILHHAPAELQQELYRLFGAQMIYNHQDNQVSCYATITTHATQAATQLLASHHTPANDTSALLLHAPIATTAGLRGCRKQGLTTTQGRRCCCPPAGARSPAATGPGMVTTSSMLIIREYQAHRRPDDGGC